MVVTEQSWDGEQSTGWGAHGTGTGSAGWGMGSAGAGSTGVGSMGDGERGGGERGAGNTVDNLAETAHGARWVLQTWEDPFVHMSVDPLCAHLKLI